MIKKVCGEAIEPEALLPAPNSYLVLKTLNGSTYSCSC
jgi:hypothetical protein